MISGAHVIVYSKDAEVDRAFFRDVLGTFQPDLITIPGSRSSPFDSVC